MEWEVEYTDEFSSWWYGLSEAEQVDVNAKVILLQKLALDFHVPMLTSFTRLAIRI